MDYYSNFFLTSYKEEWKGIHFELYKYLSDRVIPVRATHFKISLIDGGVLLDLNKVKEYSPLFKKYDEYLSRGTDSIKDINYDILNIDNQHEKNSLIKLKSYIYELKGMWRESLSEYLNADLSTIVCGDYQPAKRTNILHKLSFLISKTDFNDVHSLIKYLFDCELLNEVLLSNLVTIHKNLNLPFFCNDSGIDKAPYSNFLIKRNVKENFAYICRDKAFELESIKDIDKAIIFMSLAKNFKPDGPLINEKLKYYEKTNS
jgi:hypothetical protein